MKIRIATRGSELALTQSKWVSSQLHKFDVEVELVIIKTQGDILLDKPLHEIGGKGLFTKEVDRAVLEGVADLSVHSLKDMPVEDEDGLVLGAIPERESTNDVLVLNNKESKSIGCGSLRRRAQVARLDLGYVFENVRGNIHTRLKKMVDNEWAGLVVAEAALKRLNLDQQFNYKILDILPSAGQGALGLRVRKDDNQIIEVVEKINSERTMQAAFAESKFLQRLGGGCHIPAGIRSVISGDEIIFTGGVFSLCGREGVICEKRGALACAEELAILLAEEILFQGAEQILDKLGS